jgi:DNA-binding transcriptional ArsR family regulator
MQPGEQTRELRVTTRAQVAALENQLRARLLIACAAEERSLSDLQCMTGEALPKLHFHVTRLLSAGLLEVSRQQPRAGRSIRLFRAVADRFVIPQELLGQLPGDAMAAELRDLLQRSRRAVSLHYARDPSGNFAIKLVPEESDAPPAGMELWQVFKLNRTQRQALAKELMELFQRYKSIEQSGGETILAHAAFAPRG